MELRELPPGGREVQVLLASCSPARLSSGPFPGAALSRQEARVGGWPAGLPVDSPSGLVLQPGQRGLSPSGAGSGSHSSGRRLQPGAGFAEAALGLRAQRTVVLLAGACSPSFLVFFLSLCSSHITWDSVLWGLRHLFKYVLGPPELSRGC